MFRENNLFSENDRNSKNKWNKNFVSNISPQSNQQAEEELRREIKSE